MKPPSLLLALLLSLVLLPLPARAFVTNELEDAKTEYTQAAQQKKPGAQQAYIQKLATILDRLVSDYITTGDRSGSDEMMKIYAELKKFPAPASSDTRALTQLRLGKWESPRHQYLYRADGTCIMLPADEDSTRGRWRIEGNRYYDGSATPFTPADTYTIILLDKKYFIFMSADTVFFEHRLGK